MQRSTAWQRAISIVSTLTLATFGFTGLVSADAINQTGPDSNNSISRSLIDNCSVTNNNNLNASNRGNQTANSGDTEVTGNTTAGGGETTTGDASNANSFNGAVNIENNAPSVSMPAPVSTATISNTGPGSSNALSTSYSTTTTVTNNNNVSVSNSNGQTAKSGDATVSHNTTAGSVTTGNASNSNSASFLATIHNNLAIESTDGATCVAAAAPAQPIAPVAPGMGGNFSTEHTMNVVTIPAGQGSPAGGGYSGTGYTSANTTRQAAATLAHNATANAPSASSKPIAVGGMGGGYTPSAPATQLAYNPSISNTGPDSNNSITQNYSSNTKVSNTNNISFTNTNNQAANSGSTSSTGNTTTYDNGSGAAANGNASSADLSAHN